MNKQTYNCWTYKKGNGIKKQIGLMNYRMNNTLPYQ